MNQKIKGLYKCASYITFNVVVLLLLANIALGAYYFVFDKIELKQGKSPNDMYPMSDYDTLAFGNVSIEKIKQINTDFNALFRRGMYYQPWVEYSEPLFESKTVNVLTDPTGIPLRKTPNSKKTDGLPTFKVYCFGGSTTFGYNVADEQTYPAYLDSILKAYFSTNRVEANIEVVNYGRGYYSPSEELQLLIDLLKLGHRPSLVIFLDGLNMGQPMDIPNSTEVIVNRFYDIQFRPDNMSAASKKSIIPLVRLTDELRNKWFPAKPIRVAFQEEPDALKLVPLLINRFVSDKAMAQKICELYHIPSMFFSQPVAPYNYPLHFYSRLPFEDTTEPHLRGLFLNGVVKRDTQIISLHHLFEKWNRKAIVDFTHYSPDFNLFLAQHVALHINKTELLAHPFLLDTAAATGLKRTIADKIYELSKANNITEDPVKIDD